MKWNSWGLKLYAFHKFHIVDLFYSFWISWMARKIKGERIRIECGWSQPGARYKEGHLMIIRFHNATWCLCLLCHLVHFFFDFVSRRIFSCCFLFSNFAHTRRNQFDSIREISWADEMICRQCEMLQLYSIYFHCMSIYKIIHALPLYLLCYD